MQRHGNEGIETMVDKTLFEVKRFLFNYSERLFIVAPNYQLAGDKVRKEFVPPQRYCYDDLNCYVLNVVKGL